MYKLKIISSTVRPGRKGTMVGKWITDLAAKQGNFEVEFLDLGEINLPLMNEPIHPSMKQYEHEHTKQWSAKIEEADAFIFVTGEYNYDYPAPLKNALEYLLHEWGYKAAGIVSYSAGPYAGVRAVVNLKGDLISFKCVALAEVVNIALVNKLVDEEGLFTPTEAITTAAHKMLGQLVRWTKGMQLIKNDK